MINKEYYSKIISVAVTNGMPMQLSKLIACQSALETANWTSNNFIKSNNGFGYKYVNGASLQNSKPVVHSTESDYYASYPNFENSIIEICRWILRRQKEGKFPQDLLKIQNAEQYAKLLKDCGFYGGLEKDYANNINQFFNQIA